MTVIIFFNKLILFKESALFFSKINYNIKKGMFFFNFVKTKNLKSDIMGIRKSGKLI